MRMRKKWWALPELKESPIFRYRPMENKGKWNEDFNNAGPIYLELGSGMGSFINYLKNTFKRKNFVGIDMEEGCLVYAKRILEEEDASNVRLVLADIRNIDEYFAESEVEEIYINFPNPWPKNRQHKRRLTYPDQLKMYKKILKSGGTIRLKTDDMGLYEASLKYFESEGFEIIFKTDDLNVDEFKDDFTSEYETKWRSQGVNIKAILVRNVK